MGIKMVHCLDKGSSTIMCKTSLEHKVGLGLIVEMREGDERLPLSFLLRMELSVRDVRDLLWKRLKVKFRGVRFTSGLA